MRREFSCRATQYVLVHGSDGDQVAGMAVVGPGEAEGICEALLQSAPHVLRELWSEVFGRDELRLRDAEIADRLATALRDPIGEVRLYQRRGRPLASAPSDRVVELAELAADLVDDTTTWIAFELLDQNDEAIGLLHYELTEPSGSVRSGQLNSEGVVFVDGIDPGTYKIAFLEAELVELGEDGPNVADLEDFGVTSVVVRGAGGEESTSWTSDDDPPDPDDPVDLHIAPETETVAIAYTIEDPQGRTERATIEVFIADDDGDDQILWTRELEADEYAAGDHEIEWDGTLEESEFFPDGFVCVEHSPYTLRIRIESATGEARPPEASTRFAVDVAEIELELGDRLALSRDIDKALYDVIAPSGVPAPGSTLDLKLISNVYKLSLAEMTTNAAFRAYEALWSAGPQVPVFASLKLKNTAGDAVVAPKGLGKLGVVWEWGGVDCDTSALNALPKAFVDDALDFDKDLTEPEGDNCHVDRGGLRGPDAPAVFPSSSGYAPADALEDGRCPFKVEPDTERANVSISEPWTSGALGGKTGVLFQPSRMAGDVWNFRVYLQRDGTPDGPADGATVAQSGDFKVKREVHVVRGLKKKSGITNANLSTFGSHYTPADMVVENKVASIETMTAATYNARFTAAIAAQSATVRASIDPTVDQHAGGNWALNFRTWVAWQAAIRAARGFTAAQMTTWLAGTGARYNTAPKYRSYLKGWAKRITTAACTGYMPAASGITVIQFARLYNLETLTGSRRLGGWAPSVAAPVRDKCMFIMCNASYSNTAWVKATLAHEIGHQLFLPHSPFPAPGTAGAPSGSGDWQERHDATDSQCIMSYSSGALEFCGLCLLRLRGWSTLWLSKQPDENSRP